MRFGLIPLSFKSPRYLIIYEDVMTTSDELSQEILDLLADKSLRVVDLDAMQEVLPDETTEDLEDDAEAFEEE